MMLSEPSGVLKDRSPADAYLIGESRFFQPTSRGQFAELKLTSNMLVNPLSKCVHNAPANVVDEVRAVEARQLNLFHGFDEDAFEIVEWYSQVDILYVHCQR